ncbi:M4 family metallopeptidase [Pleionea sediminis]|uniref:M4 family metallopeptidase n=1 Tax=Pleionea sediminis TaxID=2569479 RepID=UPI001184CEE9|nr:M4 family metallopeptidase [Pleionea sediminis]
MKNKFKLKTASLFFGIFATTIPLNSHAKTDLSIENKNIAGQMKFLTEKISSVNSKSENQTFKGLLKSMTSYDVNGSEDFSIRRQWTDSLGKKHITFEQTIDGLKVYGSNMTMHLNVTSNTLKNVKISSDVYAISGVLAVADDASLLTSKRATRISSKLALAAAENIGKVSSKPELAYVYLPELEKAKLSWKIDVKYDTEQGFEHDIIFFDAHSAVELIRHPLVHRAKSYDTYTMENEVYDHYSKPGRLLCTTGRSCPDASAQNAHDGASIVYDYYFQVHDRDSIDDNGMKIISSVHTGYNWNNAVWYIDQMMYGDGDGTEFGDLTGDLDVIGHELTHGVTQNTAGLIYYGESGAINEAMSDIMGASVEAFHNGSTPNWKIGDAVYTPRTPNDALRYMDDPAKDGFSRDYYPDRYRGTGDKGGVHINSGIANLAYTLLVDGGTHPRNKTSVVVPGIGLSQAEQIFYRALTTYFSPSTDFAAARTGTAQAALDLYGQAAKTAVETAWCAVGVGSCPSEGDEGENNNEPMSGSESNITISRGDWKRYSVDLPTGYSTMIVRLSGGRGDADLYLKRNGQPTTRSFDCRSYNYGNDEECIIDNPSSGTWSIGIYGYEYSSGITITFEARP